MNWYNLNGTVLRIASRYDNLYPYDVSVNSSVTCSNGNPTVNYRLTGGYATELFMHLQNFLNFRYEIVSEVGAYNFTLAENKSIDLFMASYVLTYSRALIVSPTFSTGRSKVMAFFNHETEFANLSLFFPPFGLSLWLGVLVFLTLSYFGVVIIGSQERNRNIFDLSVHFISTVLQNEYPKCLGSSLRIAFFSVSITVSIILISYAGNMASMKSIHACSLDSTQKLIHSSANHKFIIEIGTGQPSSIRTMLERLTQTTPDSCKLWELIESSTIKNIISFEQAIIEVQQRPTIYIIDEQTGLSTAEKVLGQFPCTWKGVNIFQLEYPWTMYVRQMSPHKSSINYGILRLQETGLRFRIASKWLPKNSACPAFVLPFQSISISQIHYAFAVLATGVLFSFASIVWEQNFCCFYRLRGKSEGDLIP